MATPSKAGTSYAQYDAINGASRLEDAWSRYRATQARQMSARDKAAFSKAYRAGLVRYGRKSNPKSRLKSNRLTPVKFTIKGKRHTGKAKLVGGKVKIFVTPNTARKINPNDQYMTVVKGGGTVYKGPSLAEAEKARLPWNKLFYVSVYKNSHVVHHYPPTNK